MSNWVVPSWVVPHYGTFDVTDSGEYDPTAFLANLLLEDGDHILNEDGSYLLTEITTAING